MNARRETWTRLHGPLPKGFLVYVLNGQPHDVRDENLAAIPRYPTNVGELITPFQVRIRELEKLLMQQEEKLNVN